jgi:hypothetical protein
MKRGLYNKFQECILQRVATKEYNIREQEAHMREVRNLCII